MDKIILIALIFLGNFGLSQNFTFGPKFGANISNFESKVDSLGLTQTYKLSGVGLGIGVFARFGKRFYLQPGIVYNTHKGLDEKTVTYFGVTYSTTTEVEKSDIDIAFLFGYKIIDAKMNKLRLNGGIKYSSNINGKASLTSSVLGVNYTDINTNFFKNGSLNYTIGLGMDVTKITFDVRYTKSINSDIDTEDKSKTSLSYVEISVGFKIL